MWKLYHYIRNWCIRRACYPWGSLRLILHDNYVSVIQRLSLSVSSEHLCHESSIWKTQFSVLCISFLCVNDITWYFCSCILFLKLLASYELRTLKCTVSKMSVLSLEIKSERNLARICRNGSAVSQDLVLLLERTWVRFPVRMSGSLYVTPGPGELDFFFRYLQKCINNYFQERDELAKYYSFTNVLGISWIPYPFYKSIWTYPEFGGGAHGSLFGFSKFDLTFSQ